MQTKPYNISACKPADLALASRINRILLLLQLQLEELSSQDGKSALAVLSLSALLLAENTACKQTDCLRMIADQEKAQCMRL